MRVFERMGYNIRKREEKKVEESGVGERVGKDG